MAISAWVVSLILHVTLIYLESKGSIFVGKNAEISRYGILEAKLFLIERKNPFFNPESVHEWYSDNHSWASQPRTIAPQCTGTVIAQFRSQLL